MMKLRSTALIGALFCVAALSSCTKHEIETKSQVEVAPIEVKPIHITIDVNLRVERALDDVFKDIDQAEAQRGQGAGQESGGGEGNEQK